MNNNSRNIQIALFTILVVIFTSCVEDLGNYDYKSREEAAPVKINGVPQTIQILTNQELIITPELENLKEEDGIYEFYWHVYENKPNSSQEELQKMVRDTLSTNKDLQTYISLKKGAYILLYEIRNTQTLVRTYFETELQVEESEINYGYYILKDDGSKTDFDYIGYTGVRYSNILQNIPGDARPNGTAVKIILQNASYAHRITDESGNYITPVPQDLDAIHIISSQEYVVRNANNISQKYKGFEDMFYEIPEEGFGIENCTWDISLGSNGLYIINKGKMYVYFSGTFGYGMYGSPVGGFSNNKIMYPETLVLNALILGYDKVSKKFYYTATVIGVDDFYDSEAITPWIRPAGTDLDLVTLLPGSIPVYLSPTNSKSGKAIFRDLNSSDFYWVDIVIGYSADYQTNPKNPVVSCTKLPADSKLKTATCLLAPNSGSFIYYAENNRLMATHDPALGLGDELVYTFGAEEKIVYMTQDNINPQYAFDTFYDESVYMVVLTTTSDNNWNLYVFDRERNAKPGLKEILHQYSGEGNAKYVAIRNRKLD